MIKLISDASSGDLSGHQICVIGAGPAGIDLAIQLASCGVRVLLLEGGEAKFQDRTQALHQMVISGRQLAGEGYDFRADLTGPARTETRIRQLGGTSNIWSGKWKVPDEVDFSDRPWIAEQGWPVEWEEVKPFAQEVCSDYGMSALFKHNEDAQYLIDQVAPDFSGSAVLDQQEPLRFGSFYLNQLRENADVTVLLDANVVELQTDANNRHVQSVRVKSITGREWKIKAEQFVLCTGGIEVPRLLLLSETNGQTGIGNASEWVGRGYMDHPKTLLGGFAASHNLEKGISRQLLRPQGMEQGRLLITLGLSAENQKRLRTGNHALFLAYAGEKRKHGRRLFRRLANIAHPPRTHLAILYAETRPSRESYVGLSDETDALGIPLPRLHWSLTERDIPGLRNYVRAMRNGLKAAGLGVLRVNRAALRPSAFSHASHPMGTARMARSEEKGVVDRDCRVFGMSNLYVLSSAVFPVSGNANPTLLILALGRRLAHHLCRTDGEIQIGK